MTSCFNAHQDLSVSIVDAIMTTDRLKQSRIIQSEVNTILPTIHSTTQLRRRNTQCIQTLYRGEMQGRWIWIECAMRVRQYAAASLYDTRAQFQVTRCQLWQSWYLIFKSRQCVEAQSNSGSGTSNQKQRNNVVLTCRSFCRCCLESGGPAVVPP
jgi:hypothetical protein